MDSYIFKYLCPKSFRIKFMSKYFLKIFQAQQTIVAESVARSAVPTAPGSSVVYPGLAEFMGLELSDEIIAANMPEYLPQNQVAVPPPVSLLYALKLPLSKQVVINRFCLLTPCSNVLLNE